MDETSRQPDPWRFQRHILEQRERDPQLSNQQSSELLPPRRIVGENFRQVTQRQMQHCRRYVGPGIMGARTAIEQRDFPEPLRCFGKRYDRSPARRRDSAETDGAGQDAIDAVRGVAAVEYGFAGAEQDPARRTMRCLSERPVART